MNLELEKDFLSKVDTLRNKNNLLHFSCGADSIACFLRLREFSITPILVYNYFIKDLPMVKNYIDWFEKKFNVHVYQFPSTLFSEMFWNAQFQHPIRDRRERFRNTIAHYGLGNHTKEWFDSWLADNIGGGVIHHIGLKYTDGLRRYQFLIKNGCSFKNKFYPIASFQVKDIQAILEKHECLLPIDYSLWGLSFESPRGFNINLIKEHCPETYRQICAMFPQIGSEGLRKYAVLNKNNKQRITQFGKYAMKKEMCPVW